MGIYVNPGNQAFLEIDDSDYVDKTRMIHLINKTIREMDKLICVSRPRRFGKSYAAKMLAAYYDCSCDSHSIFDNKMIAESDSYEEHLNKYNVIYIDVFGFVSSARRESISLSTVPLRIVNAIKDEILRFDSQAPKEGSFEECVIHCVNLPEGRSFESIIDEWDSLIREVKDDKDALNAYLNLLRGWFKNNNFTPAAVAAAYMTVMSYRRVYPFIIHTRSCRLLRPENANHSGGKHRQQNHYGNISIWILRGCSRQQPG